MPMDIPERPNTRRSHLRSRGDAGELTPAQGMGLGDDSIPPTRDTAPQMPVRRPEPPVAANSGGSNRPVLEPVTDPALGGVAPASVSAGQGSGQGASSLIVISNKKNLSSKEQQLSSGSSKDAAGAPLTFNAITPAPTPVAPTSLAPDAPKSSAPSSSAGGRRGKNITSVTVTVNTTNTTPAVAATDLDSPEARFANLNIGSAVSAPTAAVAQLSVQTVELASSSKSSAGATQSLKANAIPSPSSSPRKVVQ